MSCPDNAECSKDCFSNSECPVHKDFVRCDDVDCKAKRTSLLKTLEDYKTALEHWQSHGLYHGCSHGQ